MDAEPPTSEHKMEGAEYKFQGMIWINKHTKVHLSAADEGSGLQGTYFRLGRKASRQPYSEPFAIEQDGRYVFEYYSTDNVNNREPEHVYVLIADNTAPEIVTTFSVENTGTVQAEDGTPLNIYPRHTILFLGASDNSTGIAGIWYSINEEKEQEYAQPVMLSDEGNYSIRVRAKDYVDNTVSQTTRFVIKD